MTVFAPDSAVAYFPVLFVGMTIPVRVAQYVHDPVKPGQGGLFLTATVLFLLIVNPAK